MLKSNYKRMCVIGPNLENKMSKWDAIILIFTTKTATEKMDV